MHPLNKRPRFVSWDTFQFSSDSIFVDNSHLFSILPKFIHFEASIYFNGFKFVNNLNQKNKKEKSFTSLVSNLLNSSIF